MTTISTSPGPVFARMSRSWQLLPLVAALSLGLAGMQAQAEGMGAPCGHQMTDKGMGAMHTAHLGALKKQLKLSPEQDAAWTQWVEAIHPMDMVGHPDMKKGGWDALTTPQRLDKMRALHEENSQRMAQALARHTEATKTFYAALTEAQQKTFDEATLRHMFGKAHRGH